MHIYKALEFARNNGERITSSNFTQSETPGKWDHKKHVVKNWNSENLVIGGGGGFHPCREGTEPAEMLRRSGIGTEFGAFAKIVVFLSKKQGFGGLGHRVIVALGALAKRHGQF